MSGLTAPRPSGIGVASEAPSPRCPEPALLDLIDRRAILGGAIACLLLTGPAAIILAVVDRADDGEESNWVLAVLILIVAGFLLGGARAGRSARQAPFLNGAAATLVVFVVVQGIAAIANAIDGDGVNVVAVVFNALLAASIGTVGAWFGIRRTSRST
jgi:putative membrane protein (TIGR04086 family)